MSVYLIPPIRVRLFVDEDTIDIRRILYSPFAFRIPLIVPQILANRRTRRRIVKRTRHAKHSRTLTISVCYRTCVESNIGEIMTFVPVVEGASGNFHHPCWHIRTSDMDRISPRDRHCPLTSFVIAYGLLEEAC